jgi:hypothetical protein
VYIAGVIFAPDLSFRETAHHPVVIIPDVLTTLAFLTLAVALPGLAGRTRLPKWALYISAAGCAFMGAIAWVGATYVPRSSFPCSDRCLKPTPRT